MIESLHSGHKGAVEVIDKSREKAVNCVENARRSIQSMERVSDTVKDTNQMNDVKQRQPMNKITLSMQA